MQTLTGRSAGLIGKAGAPGGTPVSEFLLVPFGFVYVESPLSGHDFTFTRAHALAAVQWFAGLGRELAIDFEHQTLDQFNRRPDGLAPAAGWIGRLEVRADGLWAADVKWTHQARTLLATGQYRYPSPVIYWSDEQYSELTGLGPVGLTNDPALTDLAPLAAARCGPDLACFCRLMPDHPICTTRTGESNMALSSVFQGNPQLAHDASDGGESEIAAIEAFREAHRALAGVFDGADATTRGRIVDELTDEDYELFDGVSEALFRLREMTATAAGSRGGISGSVLAGKWRWKFEASPALRAEFGQVETFIAYKRAEAGGCVRILGSRQTPPARPSAARASSGFNETVLGEGDGETAWKAAYAKSPELQKEFDDVETFVAFKKHEKAGHVQIFTKQRSWP